MKSRNVALPSGMPMRPASTSILVALLASLPLGGAAEPSDSFQGTTAPVTRDYLDPLTDLVYHYDAATGVLTPTGRVAAVPVAYMRVDVHSRGQQPDAASGETTPCDHDVCVIGVVAVVGARHVQVAATLLPSGAACPSYTVSQHAPAPLGVVSYFRFKWGVDYCAPGSACAYVYIDGVARNVACNSY